jgi:uncharacterized protein (DUF433 family)
MSTEISTLLVSSPDICGGRLRIDGTGTTVNQIVLLYKQGVNADEIVDQYPHLTLAQVYAALAHYHANQEEIEADLEAEKNEIKANKLTGSVQREVQWKAFKELQRRLNLNSAKAAEWQNAVHEARR